MRDPFISVALLLIAIILLGAIVLRPARSQQHHHPLHMDFYRHWMQPGISPPLSCCDARIMHPSGNETGDCEPTRAEVRNGQWFAWLRQEHRWLPIPDSKIIREKSPNIFDAHLCWLPGKGVLCFVPPATGG